MKFLPRPAPATCDSTCFTTMFVAPQASRPMIVWKKDASSCWGCAANCRAPPAAMDPAPCARGSKSIHRENRPPWLSGAANHTTGAGSSPSMHVTTTARRTILIGHYFASARRPVATKHAAPSCTMLYAPMAGRA
eukprot:CAMPEP_0172742214 /NCGR_PEP_ID=MMETSP1074-20121228/128947_1 /TAXON_ID=2916 /ORGANISM="Ceratium fusus, Strain PA161109" /LENGTH=134 /DNA_ID=CAMNT_0013572713 /DNA_START=10 /DNA_END=414 /DNA_ORIENTATION=+